MIHSRNDLRIRFVLALMPLGITFWLFFRANDPQVGMITVFPLLSFWAFIIYPSLTSVIGEWFSTLILPHSFADKPKAPLSKVDRLLLERQWGASESALIELGREFPHDMEVWSRLFRVVWVHKGDCERAKDCHRIALQVTKESDLRFRINHIYTLYAQSHLAVEEEWEKETVGIYRRTAVAQMLENDHKEKPILSSRQQIRKR